MLGMKGMHGEYSIVISLAGSYLYATNSIRRVPMEQSLVVEHVVCYKPRLRADENNVEVALLKAVIDGAILVFLEATHFDAVDLLVHVEYGL